MSKSDADKIWEWATSLQHTDPERWEQLIDGEIRQGMTREAAMAQLVRARVASCQVHKSGIPPNIQWCGRESEHDKECPRCEVLQAGGKMRYLGHHYFGLIKVAKVWYEEDVEICDDVDQPYYLHCWRCCKCGNEDTDDWFL